MVYGLYNLIDKFRRYGVYTTKEWRWFFIALPILTLIAGFDDGSDKFVVSSWLFNLLVTGLAMATVIIVYEIAQRLTGLEQAFRVTSKPILYGLLAGIIIGIMTNGKAVFLAHRIFHVDTMEAHRLGYFRYHRSYYAMGKIAFMGAFAVMGMVVLARYVPILPEVFAAKLVSVGVIFTISNMLPIPPLDGAVLLYASRLIYFFTFGSILGVGLALMFTQISLWIVIVAAIVMGILMTLFYFDVIDKSLGGEYKY